MKIFAQYGNLCFVIDDVKSGNFLCRDIAAVPDWSLEQVLRQNFYNHAKALLVVLFPIFNYSGCLSIKASIKIVFASSPKILQYIVYIAMGGNGLL